MIEGKNLGKQYGNKVVLENVSTVLPKNKIVAFIGSNGAGKSTLMSALTRTMGVDFGEIYIDGGEINVWKNNELAKRLSILRQSNHSNARLTVEELVAFGRFPHSNGRLTDLDIAKIQEAMFNMEILDLKDRYLDELSGGQRQMAYIAMIIAQDTEYIFLDEPLNNLDMKHSVKIMKILQRLVANMNKTIMIVIHDINFVSCYAHHVLAMKDGKIIEEGPTEKIISTDVLRKIYGMDIAIHNIGNERICVYYS